MSTAPAIGAVSAVLRNVLDNGLIDAALAVGTPVKVTALAPDLVKLDDAGGGPQLNLFAYRVSLNPGWRNAGQPTRDGGGRRIASPPLGVDVHYLLTAYGREDFHAEMLLGYGMHLLHERPFLDRAAIRDALKLSPAVPAVLPPAFRDPANAGLADQVEALKITWESIDLEEMSKLWSALQSHYRPSVGYQVSVILIEAPPTPGPDPLPVLTPKIRVQAEMVPPYPAIESVSAPDGAPTAELGETITIQGRHLDGDAITIHLRHPRAKSLDITDPAENADPTQLTFQLPEEDEISKRLWAGLWTVSITLTPPGETAPRTTNLAALALSAKWTGQTLDGGATRRLTITGLTPWLQPGQQINVALGGIQVPVKAPAARADRVVARFPVDKFPSIPSGKTAVRVRVDGVDSRIIDYKPKPPNPPKPPLFLNERQVEVP